jgi:hypothetical protein
MKNRKAKKDRLPPAKEIVVRLGRKRIWILYDGIQSPMHTMCRTRLFLFLAECRPDPKTYHEIDDFVHLGQMGCRGLKGRVQTLIHHINKSNQLPSNLEIKNVANVYRIKNGKEVHVPGGYLLEAIDVVIRIEHIDD